MLLEARLETIAAGVMKEALGLEEAPNPLLRPCGDPAHGDFQINGAMALAKRLKKSPRDIAAPIADAIVAHPAFSAASVAGPGFVNLTLDPAWVGTCLSEIGGEELGIDQVPNPETIVVDYSSPNIAKQMHVGHLRSTIIGHALVQLLRKVGHKVISDNHLGDWGTQFGLLIAGLRDAGGEIPGDDPLAGLETIYKSASARAKEDPEFAQVARDELAKLQSGDEENVAHWKRFVEITLSSLKDVYERLGVEFDEWLGESAYNDRLAGVAQLLLDKRIATIDGGATCVFFHEMGEIEGALPDAVPKRLRKQKSPFIVRKKDGAFNYATSDVATVQYRREVFGADRALYVVGSPQALHFEQLFAVMKLLGEPMRLEHIAFGQIQGADGKVMRTRSGESVSLGSLLDEAVAQSRRVIEEKLADETLRIPADEIDHATEVIGIGAVKYNDLMKNRTTDYRFDLETMVSFSGNAGPYLHYQYARTRSIFRKDERDWPSVWDGPIEVVEPAELALAKTLLRFGEVVWKAGETSLPHLLCDHMYSVARALSKFYTDCPVLKSEGATRSSRLGLVWLAGRQLEVGLDLLGIDVLEQM
jgi:arginyl-tRNA synthetase